MSEQINIRLTPEAERLLADMQGAPVELPLAVAGAMRLQNAITLNHIKEDYLAFPRGEPPVEIGLRKMSGRLLQSAWAAEPEIDGQIVRSAIGDNVTNRGVNYAEIHEFGGDFTRKGGTVRLLTDAHGTLLGQSKNAKLAVFARTKNKVRKMDAHFTERHFGKHTVHYPERRPFRRGIEDRLPDYGRAVSGAVVAALKGNGQSPNSL